MNDVRRNEENRRPELHFGQAHESKEVKEERIGNQPRTLLIEADRKEISPVTTNQHMTGFDLDRQAETKLLLQVGLDVRRSSSVIGTMTSRSPPLPNVRILATSVSVKRLNWTLLRGLVGGITGRALPVCI